MKLTAICLLCLALGAGCTPSIGGECDVSLDCSALGNRLCDQTQPGGYCTIPGCERGTCPDDALCVLFRPEQPRLSQSYCMAPCGSHGDCRMDDGYRCVGADAFGREGAMEAEVLDGAGERFCAQPAPQLLDPSSPDAGT